MRGNNCEKPVTPFTKPRPLVSLSLSFLPELCTSFHSPHQPVGPLPWAVLWKCRSSVHSAADNSQTPPLWTWSLDSSQAPFHTPRPLCWSHEHSPPCWARPISRSTMGRPRGGWALGTLFSSRTLFTKPMWPWWGCSHSGWRLLGAAIQCKWSDQLRWTLHRNNGSDMKILSC